MSSERTVTSLAPGHILWGADWNYFIRDAIKGDTTHTSSVFKAEVVPHETVLHAPQWAVIKAASPSDRISMESLERERQIYLLSDVASSACFRKMYEMIGSNSTGATEAYIALEWMDTTLADVKYQRDMCTYSLIEMVLTAALKSCVILDAYNYVNTDYKPANILLSAIYTSRTSAKVGDLGLVFPAGQRFNSQPYSMRAPEVFLGQACNGPSQVWAVAAMLLCWIKPGVLGEWDSPNPWLNTAWSIAKLKRLFPGFHFPSPDEIKSDSLKVIVKSAERLSREVPDLQAILSFEEEIQDMVPNQLRDLLSLMLVANPDNRPSASSVLASIEFRKFKKLIRD